MGFVTLVLFLESLVFGMAEVSPRFLQVLGSGSKNGTPVVR